MIAVPTFRRHDLLLGLLPRLVEQLLDVEDDARGRRILVADNDPAGSARETVRRASTGQPVRIDYIHVPTPGVSACRNACLHAAAPGELLVFIDDDQVPRAHWLGRLLAAYSRTEADAVAGPTRPVYTTSVPRWIELGPFHDASYLPRDARLSLSAVTNCLFDIDVVRATGVEFPEIGTRGGEDSWFTTQFVRAGATISWEPDAIVDEPVPVSRTSARWVMTRSIGNGVLAGRIGVRSTTPAPTSLSRVRYTGAGLVRLAAGAVRAGVGALRRDDATKGAGLHTFARGLGMTIGAWDVVFDEYARDGARRWHFDRDPFH